MPRVVFFNHYFFFPAVSGGNLVVSNHVDYLIRRGMDVRILVPLNDSEEHRRYSFEHNYSSAGVRFIKMSDKEPDFTAKLYRNLCGWSLREHLQAFDMLGSYPEVREEIGQADILVSNSAMSAPLLKQAGSQCVSIVENHNHWASLYEFFSKGNADLRAEADLEMEVLSRFNHIISISPREARLFSEHLSQERVFYVPPYVTPTSCERKTTSDLFDIGFLSSRWEPNIQSVRDFYFECYLPKLKPRHIEFVLAGRVCDAFGVRDHTIHKLGWVDRIADFYAQCKIVVCPIMYGAGCNIKLVEAMTMGKPIVATARAISGMNVDPDRLLIAEDFQSFADHIIALVDSPDLLEQYSRRSIEQTEAGHTRDHYDEAMDRLYDAAAREALKRGQRGCVEPAQRNRRETGGRANNGPSAVVFLDPSVTQQDSAIYDELLRYLLSAEDYRIDLHALRNDCSWTSSIDETTTRTDGLAAQKLEETIGPPLSPEGISYWTHLLVNNPARRMAAATVELIRRLFRLVEKVSGPSGIMTFLTKSLKKVYRKGLEHRQSESALAFTPKEITLIGAVSREFLSTIDTLGLGPTDVVVVPEINPLKLAALEAAIRQRDVYKIPRLKLMFHTSIVHGKPSNGDYFDRCNKDMELYRETFERLSNYRSTARLEFIAVSETLKDQYEVITDYRFVLWPGNSHAH